MGVKHRVSNFYLGAVERKVGNGYDFYPPRKEIYAADHSGRTAALFGAGSAKG